MELREITEGFTLERVSAEKAGNCDACEQKSGRVLGKAPLLVINHPMTYMCYCPLHEGELLQKLLSNYIKRIRRDSKVGFIGPLVKEEEEAKASGKEQASGISGSEPV